MTRTAALFSFLLVAALLPLGCQSAEADQNTRLAALEKKQDSILTMLKTIRDQSEFVAMRVGWRPPPDTTPKDIPLEGSFSTGPANAALTVVEFSDFQCPYCARLSPVIDSLAKAYPRDVRVVFKHFPLSFHAQARGAAAAAIAAGKQGKFFEFRSRVMPNFRALDDSLYLAVAKDLRLDMTKFRKDMVLTDEVNALLDADIALGRELGVEGTPTIFLNGRLAQERSFDYFAAQVAEAKKKKR